MYIDSFWCGVIATIVIEFALIFLTGCISQIKDIDDYDDYDDYED